MADIDTWLAIGVIFDVKQAQEIISNQNTLATALQSGVKKGVLGRVKRNLYVVLDPATGEPYASKFQIASYLSEDAVVSHVSAFQYHGVYNQVTTTVYYTSATPKRDAYFGGVNYRALLPRLTNKDIGVINERWDDVRATDLERTLLDSIYDIGKVVGVEEIIEIIEMLTELSEEKILNYMNFYKNKSFIQRLGFLLERYSRQKFSEEFYCILKNKIGTTKSYLLPQGERQNGNEIYNSDWQLIVPTIIAEKRLKGIIEDAS
jgi:predicted transcriptional regulator of viral defense system